MPRRSLFKKVMLFVLGGFLASEAAAVSRRVKAISKQDDIKPHKTLEDGSVYYRVKIGKGLDFEDIGDYTSWMERTKGKNPKAMFYGEVYAS